MGVLRDVGVGLCPDVDARVWRDVDVLWDLRVSLCPDVDAGVDWLVVFSCE